MGPPSAPDPAQPAVGRDPSTLIYHPKVVAAIEAIMRKSERGQEVEDAVHDVMTAAMEWLRTAARQPETWEEWRCICRAIAKNVSIKKVKKRHTERKRGPGLTDQADEHAPLPNPTALDIVDVNRAFAELRKMLDSGELPPGSKDLIDAVAAGDSLRKYADETNQPYDRVRKQQVRARRMFGVRLETMGMGAILAAVVVVVVNDGARTFVGDSVARLWRRPLYPLHSPDYEPPPMPTEPAAPTEQELVNLREARANAEAALFRAALAYKRHEWRKCIQRAYEAQHADTNVYDLELLNECTVREHKEGYSK